MNGAGRQPMYRLMVFLAALAAGTAAAAVPDMRAVLVHYADLAHAKYGDALIGARELAGAVDTLVANPTAKNLLAARAAWKAARVPYQQTEVYRFGNPIVDDWEGRVNAWPLDEGLIDYVATAYGTESDENPLYTANVIANERLVLSGRTIDARQITPQLLAKTLHEVEGVEANVATGYHAVEFLLWGQDLNGTGPGAGNRPATDFDPANCTGGHCDRRAAYLRAAVALLVEDLEWMTAQWAADGAARTDLLSGGSHAGIAAIFTGLGSLSYGELAGERMKLGLMLHDPEEEHDCFSDNTHWSHYYNALGMRNVYTGRYTRIDGRRLEGPAVSALVAAQDAAVDRELRAALDNTLAKLQRLVDSAERDGVAYDQLIAANNREGNALVMAAVEALLEQTRAIEKAIAALDLAPIGFEGSDSLAAPRDVR